MKDKSILCLTHMRDSRGDGYHICVKKSGECGPNRPHLCTCGKWWDADPR